MAERKKSLFFVKGYVIIFLQKEKEKNCNNFRSSAFIYKMLFFCFAILFTDFEQHFYN